MNVRQNQIRIKSYLRGAAVSLFQIKYQIQGGAAGRTEQGRLANRTELGKLQAYVNDGGKR